MLINRRVAELFEEIQRYICILSLIRWLMQLKSFLVDNNGLLTLHSHPMATDDPMTQEASAITIVV